MQFDPRSLATQLSRVKGLGSAKSGTKHFWHQRVSAVALVPLTILFVILLISLAGADYATAVKTLKNPFVAILMLCFVLAGVYHMRLGMQVIIEDYIHTEGTKLFVLMLNTFFAALMGLSAVYALLKISLGM
ncbi:MAG: succinate dehydrogenase, hydrophobic membrane anchor protein [Proteobacteria bacterium]|nr:succinate dehydrogenase, hydrophobic membrane anchor protein [Pseudomonadota bacterium]